ncbi:ABC transporter substrate-binding protein [Rhizobiaceae bacterium BDR2-2]|uniref:ABC transporter substrate-binding protein n=1 Tax=Ectorhizobium quercum TaxID=2965071 RepID=A0AAE3N2A9_9HYPH|nr:ABC transporter substrate-binding protein [Ectorhizobium quercum]MCX8999708.1 ABC transporter substrate-binding protein [Ectorhizobium quercum]
MSEARALLKLNEGDPSEQRLYYLPHYVAADKGFFAGANLEVLFTRTATGGHTVRGGQIPAVLSGEADLTIGGPMVTMKMLEEGTAHLVNICAAVRTHPWYLLSRQPMPEFSWDDLRGRTVVDIANIGTATFTFSSLLKEKGLAGKVGLSPAPLTESEALAAFVAGDGDFAIQHLHAAGPALAKGEVFAVQDLATATGGVPWSAYIALPEVVDRRRADFKAFAEAMDRAFAWICEHDGTEIAALIGHRFPFFPRGAMAMAIDLYRKAGLWPPNQFIPQQDFERFSRLLVEAGWLSAPADYEKLVRPLD